MAYKQPLVTGSWTPVLTFGGASTGITFSSNTALYTQLGNLVYLQARMLLSSKGSATGAAAITGLPFASTVPCELTVRVSGTTFSTYLVLETSGSSLLPYNVLSAGTGAQLTDADFTNNTILIFSGVYITAST